MIRTERTSAPRLLTRLSWVGYLILALAMLALIYIGAVLAKGAVGMAVQLVAVVLMVWARLTFGWRSFHAGANPTEGGLVTVGPYRFLRHPIYGAVLLFICAAVATNFSALILALGVVAALGVAIRIVAEERLLRERYPEYVSYAARTRRLVPYVF